jgi:ribulose-5-phosphate 4-epimerase/fuculose-1-phosphate aldolase
MSSTDEARSRVELAAAFRWAARLGMNEAVANHFSAAVSDDGKQFLLNPKGAHFSRVKASDLLLLDATGAGREGVDPKADATAWFLHAHLHQHVPRARVVMHTHMPWTTALCCVKDYELLMLDQNACRFHGRIAYDRHYSGMALDDAEGERVAKLFGDDNMVLFAGNHGPFVVADTVAEAFDVLYYLERAAQVQVLALSTGRELDVIPDDIAALAEKQWRDYAEGPRLHFDELLAILDADEPDYAR